LSGFASIPGMPFVEYGIALPVNFLHLLDRLNPHPFGTDFSLQPFFLLYKSGFFLLTASLSLFITFR